MQPQPEKPQTDCNQLGQFAAEIMDNRQLGVDIGTIMGIFAAYPAFQTMVLAAYEQPQYASEGRRADAVQTFKNDVMLMCYKSNQ